MQTQQLSHHDLCSAMEYMRGVLPEQHQQWHVHASLHGGTDQSMRDLQTFGARLHNFLYRGLQRDLRPSVHQDLGHRYMHDHL